MTEKYSDNDEISWPDFYAERDQMMNSMTDLSVEWEFYYNEKRDRVNWSGMLVDLMRSIRVKSRLENWEFSKTETTLADAPDVILRLQNKYYSERKKAQ